MGGEGGIEGGRARLMAGVVDWREVVGGGAACRASIRPEMGAGETGGVALETEGVVAKVMGRAEGGGVCAGAID